MPLLLLPNTSHQQDSFVQGGLNHLFIDDQVVNATNLNCQLDLFTKWVTWVVSIATMPNLVVHHCLYSQFSSMSFLATWMSLFFNVHELFWDSNMWPYEIALLTKNNFLTIPSTCNTSMKVPHNSLYYFHGNVHITLSYSLLNWVISHVNLYRDDILIIMKPFFMKKYMHWCSRFNVPCICFK